MLSFFEENSSVFIFRLAKNWFAIPTKYLKEVTFSKQVVPIPCKNNPILLGAVNINGELRLCASIHSLLGIEIPFSYNRMVVISKENEAWVFPADEIEGTVQWNNNELKTFPFIPSRSIQNHLSGEMKTDTKVIGLLDAEMLFSSLQRSLT
jgi:chemotaxis-related protein WspD